MVLLIYIIRLLVVIIILYEVRIRVTYSFFFVVFGDCLCVGVLFCSTYIIMFFFTHRRCMFFVFCCGSVLINNS